MWATEFLFKINKQNTFDKIKRFLDLIMKDYCLYLFIISCLSLFLRLKDLSLHSIWLDEAWIYQILFETQNKIFLLLDISGIFKILSYLFFKIFHANSEFILRIIPALYGFLSCLMVYKISSIVMNKYFAFLSGILSAVSPLLIIYSQDFSVYMFATFFLLLHYFYFIKFIDDFSLKNASLFGLTGFVAVNSRPHCIVFTASLMLFTITFFIAQKCKKKEMKILLIPLIMLFLSCIEVISGIMFINKMHEKYTLVISNTLINKLFKIVASGLSNLPNNLSNYSPVTNINFFYSFDKYLMWLFLIIFIISILYFILKNNIKLYSLGIGILGTIIFLCFIIINSNQFYERYFLIFQPLIIILMIGFSYEISKNHSCTRIIINIIVLLVIGFWIHLSFKSAYNVSWKPNSRNAFTEIKKNSLNNALSYCIIPYFFEWPIANFYLGNEKKIILVEKSFDFFKKPYVSLNMKNDAIFKLARNQIKKLISKRVGRIFIYTERGQEAIPLLQKELSSQYSEKKIFQKNGLLILMYTLNELNQ